MIKREKNNTGGGGKREVPGTEDWKADQNKPYTGRQACHRKGMHGKGGGVVRKSVYNLAFRGRTGTHECLRIPRKKAAPLPVEKPEKKGRGKSNWSESHQSRRRGKKKEESQGESVLKKKGVFR